MSSAVVGRDLAPDVRRVQLGVGVGGVPVAAPAAGEHHVAARHRALVHLPQVDRREVDLERALVAEGLQTHVALDPLLAGAGVDEGGAEVVEHGVELAAGLQRPPARARVLPLPAAVTLLQLGAAAEVHGVEQSAVLPGAVAGAVLLLVAAVLLLWFPVLVGRVGIVEAGCG